jgi:(1->4)-alpha-D-glucan 1-alpha-D-glucosylmutase
VPVIPRSTYRLQLSKEFPFAAAARCAGYLAGLGVSHVYCSPILQAARGSAHGYDVVDPTRINEELGGEEGFQQMVEALRANGIGVVLDVVPNHMATAGRRNPWWWDILKHGRASKYADYFDIDWDPALSPVKGKVWLGVLEDRYGRLLEQGAITLEPGAEPVVRYRDLAFPLAPETLDGQNVEAVRLDVDAFDSLLQRQHYRLSYWRSAQEELNYRRFFTIDTLIGLRVEVDEVLENSHRLIFDLVAGGAIEGLRIDHVDGLRAPANYLHAVRRHAPDDYLVVEKILEPEEVLAEQFAVQGTTGYDFIGRVEGVFVDTGSEEAMTSLYHAFTGDARRYADIVRTCKQDIMHGELLPDLERLTSLLVNVCEGYRRHRDRTRRELSEAIREVVAALRVYRTYATTGAPLSPADDARIREAVGEATRLRPDIDPELLAFIGEVLRLEHAHAAESEFTARFQQFTPAVMAKGVEDTAFYRYNRLVSLNEVGGDPGTFGHPVADFHSWCARIAASWPATMLTLSTHDTKRSADVRARLDVLSEIPAEWETAVRAWAEHNDPYRSQGYPDRALEYLMYQTLVGAWPIDEARMVAFLRKAAREAEVHTSWTSPVAAYEDAIAQFCANVFADAGFMSELQTFLGRTQIVPLGRINSLAQTALLLTCPGVPDLYQGSELWDLSLVDPDNRRSVDFALREKLLAEVSGLGPADAMARADEGLPKLWLISRVLARRRSDPDLFTARDYAPLHAHGSRAGHAVAFARGPLVAVVPRLPASLGGTWGDTALELPRGSWEDVLSGRRHQGRVALESLLGAFPVAVLARTTG